MRTPFDALLWKELHEQKWAAASAAAIALFFPVSLLTRNSADAWFAVIAALVYYPLIGGIFFGMRAAAGERAHRTEVFASALPATPLVLGAAKLAAGMIAALIPILALALLGGAFYPHSLMDYHFTPSVVPPSAWKLALASSAVTLHLLLFVAVFGLGQRSEIMAAVRGVFAVGVWGVAAVCVFNYYSEVRPLQYVRWIGPPVEWLAAAANGPSPPPLKIPIWPAAASMGVLAVAFIWRYSLAIRPLAAAKLRRLAVWSPTRLSSPLAALAWKQAAETFPLSATVLAAAAILSLLWADARELRKWLENFPFIAMLGGFLLALLIGVGTFAPDLEPRVNTFWRSRPISASAWFWSKYVIGACAMLLTIGLPALAAMWWIHPASAAEMGAFVSVAAGLGLLWLLIFSTAVAVTCLVRHTLYASILAVGAVVLFVVVTFWRATTLGEQPSMIYVLGMFSGAWLVTTALGWWLAKRDIVAYQ